MLGIETSHESTLNILETNRYARGAGQLNKVCGYSAGGGRRGEWKEVKCGEEGSWSNRGARETRTNGFIQKMWDSLGKMTQKDHTCSKVCGNYWNEGSAGLRAPRGLPRGSKGEENQGIIIRGTSGRGGEVAGPR